MRRVALATTSALATALVAVSGCSSGGGGSSKDVDVLYAGSMVALMQNQVGPGFSSATGYSVNGYSSGSTALAALIKGKTQKGDVFLSASPTVDTTLQGRVNGNWVSWYATYATSALVLGYNPKSKFASQLTSRPWYDVVTEPGFRLGMTDPATDPKGALAVRALTDTAIKQNLPALAKLATSTSGVFPEESLVGRLQAGQLDAGFFYTAEASAARIRTVPLTGENLMATFTVTILNHAPHQAGAQKFVSYLLGPKGRAALSKDGFALINPVTVSGTGVPSGLSGVLGN